MAMSNYMKAPGSTPKSKITGQDLIPIEIVDELVVKFLLNIPEVERENPLRACFQIELAHWFFVDHYCGEESSAIWKERGLIPFLPFAKLMFERCPSLFKQVANIEKVVQQFQFYKSKVPVFGAILMNQELTKVVLVQGFSNTWGFPKGKINQEEDPAKCAVREVLEETGYDCSALLQRDHFVEYAHQDRWTRLYFVRGVDPTSPFKPHTKYEIKNIGWFPICQLPESKNDTSVVMNGYPANSFFGVFPYVKRLRLWIEDKLQGRHTINAFKYLAVGRPSHILDKEPSQKNETDLRVAAAVAEINQRQVSAASVNLMNQLQSEFFKHASGNAAVFPTTPQKQSLKENYSGDNNKSECPLTPSETFQKLFFGFPINNSTTTPNNNNSNNNNKPQVNNVISNIFNSSNSGSGNSNNSGERLVQSGKQSQGDILNSNVNTSNTKRRQRHSGGNSDGRGDEKDKKIKSPINDLFAYSNKGHAVNNKSCGNPPDKKLKQFTPKKYDGSGVTNANKFPPLANIVSRTWLNFNIDTERVLGAMKQ